MFSQVFIFGASMAYGVAGVSGWADLVKQHLHGKRYSKDSYNSRYEIYNFAKPGATIDFVKNTFLAQLKDYKKDGNLIALVQVGGNDAKAINTPDNYVSNLDDFCLQYEELIAGLSKNFDNVIAVGLPLVDQTKTTPKTDPFTDDVFYFTNERVQLFSNKSKQVCAKYSIDFVEIADNKDVWVNECLFLDGLHPNQAGHDLMFKKILPCLNIALGVN